MVMTSACACAAFGLLCIAVATDYWLYTKEKLEESVNGTTFNLFWSGLFRKCKVEGKNFFRLLDSDLTAENFNKTSEISLTLIFL